MLATTAFGTSSLFIHLTVLLTPIITLITSGSKFLLPLEEPAGIVTIDDTLSVPLPPDATNIAEKAQGDSDCQTYSYGDVDLAHYK
ncbi:MAG: hypothetical protein QXX64_00840 [Nitrososphaera sp.]